MRATILSKQSSAYVFLLLELIPMNATPFGAKVSTVLSDRN